MTSEVALMNRTAVVLAADSAATVVYWENGRPAERYFKGANKIFNISATQPVGVMIYDGAEFQGVPWEVIIKAYRDLRSHRSHARLALYPDDLFDFIISDGHLFSTSQQAAQFLEYLGDEALRLAWATAESGNLEPDSTKQTAAKRNAFDRLKALVEKSDYFDGIDDAFVQANVQPHLATAAQELSGTQLYNDVKDALTADEIVAVGATAVFKKYWTTMRTSGLVFAGYGASEYFPQLVHCRCYGVLFGKLVHEKMDSEARCISVDNVSEIVPFAKSDMMKTFMFGASPTALEELDKLFTEGLGQFANALKSAGLLAPQANVDAQTSTVLETLRNQWSGYLFRSHNMPLKQVIGMFSITELSELAETLVSIESLKERVTTPSESVSGPIDVAAISKSDGFVWIRRKHYFKPDLNPRYFQRKQMR